MAQVRARSLRAQEVDREEAQEARVDGAVGEVASAKARVIGEAVLDFTGGDFGKFVAIVPTLTK